ncbi:hypothetical protein E2C01_100599 [Portunus trituberculatus]|uniref:Uncharacterized protein n=1 Tax=Portunus trituberculatus TaxID=210409 RepID=A0A5B7KHZ8_PORTR|nr:hypothetical protein [Portunus trituberculatus]
MFPHIISAARTHRVGGRGCLADARQNIPCSDIPDRPIRGEGLTGVPPYWVVVMVVVVVVVDKYKDEE